MAMKWIPLNGKKEPPADKRLLIAFDDERWVDGYLKRIEFVGSIKTYVFGAGDDEWGDATHFMIVEPPKK